MYFVNIKTVFSKMGLACHIAKIHSEVGNNALDSPQIFPFLSLFCSFLFSTNISCQGRRLPGICGEECEGDKRVHRGDLLGRQEARPAVRAQQRGSGFGGSTGIVLVGSERQGRGAGYRPEPVWGQPDCVGYPERRAARRLCQLEENHGVLDMQDIEGAGFFSSFIFFPPFAPICFFWLISVNSVNYFKAQ